MGVIIGAGTENDPLRLPLATLDGWPIPNERSTEDSPDRLQEAVDIWSKARPRAKLRSLSSQYDCVGLVFASRRTCIDSAYLIEILRRDSYRKLNSEKDVEVGDVVVYWNREVSRTVPTHVGIVVSMDPDLSNAKLRIRVLSQWGYDGEYLHEVLDVPEAFGSEVEYWSERRNT
jgi:hypothetical protein